MRVQSIEITNFKNLRDFKHEFVQGVYLFTGDNELGKSSLIDAIMLCLTGQNIPSEAITKGESKGAIKLTVGDEKKKFTIERKFTTSNPNGYLEIQTEDGMKTEKVGMLQVLFNYTDFSADEFIRWSETAEGKRKQLAIVKSFLSEQEQADILALDQKKIEVLKSRKELNDQIKVYSGMVKGDALNEEFLRKYQEPMDLNEVQNKFTEATRINAEITSISDKMKDVIEKLKHFDHHTEMQVTDVSERVLDYEKQMAELKMKIEVEMNKIEILTKQRETEKAGIESDLQNYEQLLLENKTIDIEGINQQIQDASTFNMNCQKASEFLKKRETLETLEADVKYKSAYLQELSDKRESIVRTAKIPIPGLNFTEDGLTLNDLPFESIQIATSQKIEVAARLMIAKNPKVKVFKVLNGESLGTEKLEAIKAFAKENGYQGFIEEVRRGQNKLKIELVEKTGELEPAQSE